MIGLTPEDDTPRDFTSQTSTSVTSKDKIPSAGTPRDFTSQISATLKGKIPCDSGTFAMVYHHTIEYNEGMVEVAVKVFKISPQAGRDLKKINKGINRELKVWLRLKHPTIVLLLGIAEVPDSPFPVCKNKFS
ncbi:hypothetical protein BD769DRAFT_1677216 [Suillus cothurnatus]|nr:hypothetical protein BD769DRAFT_1677216 [Suillus cothurnatus]